jgi:thiol-disulfide isomerase/thioredoxin
MRIISFSRSFVLAVFLAAGPVAAAGLTGRDAPDLTLPSPDGNNFSLSSLRGKVVYIDFWASWCGPCRKSFPWMASMQSKYGSRGLQVIGVNLDEARADAIAFLKETPASFAVAFDPKGVTPSAWGVQGMPTSYLVSRDGKVLFQHQGFTDGDRAELERRIQAALEGGK